MGKKIAWFDSISFKEKKRQEENYNHMIFPFGIQQRNEELKILKELIVNKKPEDSLYQVVLLKEIFLDALKNEEFPTYEDCVLNQKVQEDLLQWEKSPLTSRFSEQERNNLKRFAWKSIHIQEIDDLSK